jgi:4-amino-4-deoxy-L-arabinose transferase-like glycosyltransferase
MQENKPQKHALLWGIIGFLWLFGIILLYFISHKPFDDTVAFSLAAALWRLIVCLAIFSLAGSLGSFILRRAHWHPELHPLASLAISAGLGLGTLSLFLFGLGALVGVSGWVFWLLLVLPLILLHREVLSWWQNLASLRSLWQESPPTGKAMAVILGSLLASTALVALSPPVHFDSLVSHLVMPHAYLRQGQITYLPWLFMSGMPQLVEVLYLPAIALAGDPAAAFLGWGTAFLSAVGLLGYLRQRFTPAAAWAGTAALLSGYTLIMSTANAYVDWPGLFFGFAALVCLDLWRQTEDRLSLTLSGILTGLTLGTKYTSGVLAIALAGALIWHTWQSKHKLLPNLMRFSLPALLVFSPWLVKNLVSTGNPVYPLLFPSGAMTPIRLQGYQGLPPWGNWLDILFLPVRATYLGMDAASGYGVAIGPQLLGLGALAWIGRTNRSHSQKLALQNAALAALTGIGVWVIANQFSGFLLQTRYYYSLFPAFAVLAAAGYDGLARLKLPKVRLERLIHALLLLVLMLNLLQVYTDTLQSGAPQTVLGLQTTDAYLTQNLGWYYPVMQHLQQLPPEDLVLLFFEPRSLYCAGRCLPDELMDRWKRDWNTYHDIERIKSAWRSEGFTHFLYYQTGANLMRQTHAVQYTAEEWAALDRFLASFDGPTNFDDVYLLFALQ